MFNLPDLCSLAASVVLKNACWLSKNNKHKCLYALLLLALVLISGCQQGNDSAQLPDSENLLENEIEDKQFASKIDLPKQFAIGKVASEAIISGWDIDIRPDGLGLPLGSGSVEDGEVLYEDLCASCHGSFGEGEEQWPKLSGGLKTLKDSRPLKTVGSYWPYATTLWDYINRAMPFNAPKSLTANEVYAITAYVLNLNDIINEEFVLSNTNLTKIEMPNHKGFYPDDRPDTSNTRCMSNCKDPLEIKIIPGPKYQPELESEPKTLDTNTAIEKRESLTADERINADIYKVSCAVCHSKGLANAPIYGDAKSWQARLKRGKTSLYDNAINGINGMPAKGGRRDLSDERLKSVVDYILKNVDH